MKYNAIDLMIPTRGRPGGLARLVQTATARAADTGALRFSFLVDADDPETCEWVRNFQWHGKHTVLEHGKDGPHLSRYYNRLYAESPWRYEAGTLVSMVADDMYFDSDDWDAKILEAVNRRDGSALVWGDDCFIQHEKMAVNLFTTRKVVEGAGLGEFMWSQWRANMIDVVWTEIARRAGIAEYLPEVRIVHEHNNAKKVKDATHLRLREHYTFASGKWHLLNPYIDKAVEALRKNGVE